ncbi:MAG: hypothetical protein KF850_39515, partial [Labilithrix sp.]|nr:hypothetical protein [Labilithrix sp.]
PYRAARPDATTRSPWNTPNGVDRCTPWQLTPRRAPRSRAQQFATVTHFAIWVDREVHESLVFVG